MSGMSTDSEGTTQEHILKPNDVLQDFSLKNPVFTACKGDAVISKIPLHVLLDAKDRSPLVPKIDPNGILLNFIFRQLTLLEACIISEMGTCIVLHEKEKIDVSSENLSFGHFLYTLVSGSVIVKRECKTSSTENSVKRLHHTASSNPHIGLENLFEKCKDSVEFLCDCASATMYRIPVVILTKWPGVKSKIVKAINVHRSHGVDKEARENMEGLVPVTNFVASPYKTRAHSKYSK
jgi:hypothetical protein